MENSQKTLNNSGKRIDQMALYGGKKRWLIWAAAWLLVCLMVGCAELLQEAEIIFPEIAALAIGAWLAPRQPWRVSPLKMFLAIAIFSLMGVAIVRWVPLGVIWQILLAYCCCAAGLMLLHTTIYPLISAAILPVLLGTASFIYPLAASLAAGIVALGRALLLKKGIACPVEEYWQFDIRSQLPLWLKRIVCISALCCLALVLNAPFLIAPPLIVGFTEMSCTGSVSRRCPGKVILITFFGALCGCALRLTCCSIFGLPVTLAAAVTAGIFFVVVARTKVYFPPAGAIAILPMLIGDRLLLTFPFQVLLGFGLLVLAAKKLFGPGTVGEKEQ